MKIARVSTFMLLAAAVAVAGCDFQRKSVTSPTPALEPSAAIPSLLGTWSTTSGAGAPAAADPNNSCSNFKWTVSEQSDTNIAGTFTATCLGSATINGTGKAQMNGANVTVNVTGDGSMPGLSSCPFSVGGTGTIEGDSVRIPYVGSTCLGPVSGTYNLSRNYVQGPPSPPIVASPSNGSTLSTRKPTLVVNNVQPQVPSDTMQYHFEVGMDAALANRIISATVNAGSGTTSYTVPDELPYSTHYYWRVKTMASGRSSSFTSSVSFVTPAEPPPPPPPPPPAPTSTWQSCASLTGDKLKLVECVHAAVKPGFGADQAFEVTKRVVWLLRGEGAGLLIKNGGENIVSWKGYSFAAGRICYPDGHIYKVLTDVGGGNGPGWADNDFVDRSLYVPAIFPD